MTMSAIALKKAAREDGRLLLVEEKQYLGWPVIQCLEDTLAAQPNLQNVPLGDRLKVKCAQLTFSVDMTCKGDHSCYSIEVKNLVTDLSDLLIVLEFMLVARAMNDRSASADPSTWPDPKHWVKSMKGEGYVMKIPLGSTRCLTTKVAVYSSPQPPQRTLLGADLESARRAGTLCDVVLTVDGQDIPAHRAVLAARSPVFQKMFESDFKENKEGVVVIPDVPKELGNRFIEFLYTGEVAQWAGHELDLLLLADHYMVDSLKMECERRMLQVDKHGAVAMLRLSLERPIVPSTVRRRAAEIIMDNWPRLTSTEEWIAFEMDFPLYVDCMRAGR